MEPCPIFEQVEATPTARDLDEARRGDAGDAQSRRERAERGRGTER
jgi:hypothetical protein